MKVCRHVHTSLRSKALFILQPQRSEKSVTLYVVWDNHQQSAWLNKKTKSIMKYFSWIVFYRAMLEEDPFTRMKMVVRWYLSGFYKKPKVSIIFVR